MAQVQHISTSCREHEITDAMIEAGAQIIAAWYSEPGEPIEVMAQKRRCAEEVFMAMMAANDGDQSSFKARPWAASRSAR